MVQEKNDNWKIIMLRSSEFLAIIWLGSIQAIGRHQKGGEKFKGW